MRIELVECSPEYWEFVRLLRSNPENQEGFFSTVKINQQQQKIYMELNSHRYKICLSDGIPVGYVGIIKDSEVTYCVHPEHKGIGIGTKIMEEFSKSFALLDAYVKVENFSSQRIFEKLGWEKQIYYKKKKDEF
jgi:RimJ/RimL family protein N-acetyltransferase